MTLFIQFEDYKTNDLRNIISNFLGLTTVNNISI
jgi:hypothetical protein